VRKRSAAADPRLRFLWGVRRRWFEQFRFVGLDALVARVSADGPTSPAVQAKRAEGGDMRMYPVTGGYLYKWPYGAGDEVPEGFAVEAGGWDHVHCDACNRTMNAGGTVWLTVRGSFVQLCPYCYRRAMQLGAVRGGAPRRRVGPRQQSSATSRRA